MASNITKEELLLKEIEKKDKEITKYSTLYAVELSRNENTERAYREMLAALNDHIDCLEEIIKRFTEEN
jgi:hypothetical protein